MARFAKRMKEERLTLGMSQEKLAKISGVSQQAISMIEAEKRSPTEETMEMIAGGLDCTVRYLLSEHRDAKAEKEDYSPSEMRIIDAYRSLSQQGQEYIRQQLEIAKKIYAESAGLSQLAAE